MSILKHREKIDFQPENPKHREHLHQFLKYSKWGANAPLFHHDPKFVSVAHQAQAKTLEWYITRDFANSK